MYLYDPFFRLPLFNQCPAPQESSLCHVVWKPLLARERHYCFCPRLGERPLPAEKRNQAAAAKAYVRLKG